MHHGTVFGTQTKKLVPQNSPVMHCQRRYSQVSGGTSEWGIDCFAVHHHFTQSFNLIVQQVRYQAWALVPLKFRRELNGRKLFWEWQTHSHVPMELVRYFCLFHCNQFFLFTLNILFYHIHSVFIQVKRNVPVKLFPVGPQHGVDRT